MKRGKVTFLKVAVCTIGIIMLGLFIFALPSLAKYSVEMNPEYANLQYPVLIGLYLTGIPFFFALYQALKLLSYIENNNAFSELAVTSLGSYKALCKYHQCFICNRNDIAWNAKCFASWYSNNWVGNTLCINCYSALYSCSSRTFKKCIEN